MVPHSSRHPFLPGLWHHAYHQHVAGHAVENHLAMMEKRRFAVFRCEGSLDDKVAVDLDVADDQGVADNAGIGIEDIVSDLVGDKKDASDGEVGGSLPDAQAGKAGNSSHIVACILCSEGRNAAQVRLDS